MCGRFANNLTIEAMTMRFSATTAVAEDAWAPTYNAAPTHELPVVLQDQRGRRLGLMRWGWPQSWNARGLHVNAIGETAADKPAFAAAFASRRCLVPATAFYEWQAHGRQKLPYAFRRTDGGGFAIAGLWQGVTLGDRRVGAFILLTTVANAVVAPVHHRMAAMLTDAGVGRWLDPTAAPEEMRALLAPYDAAGMTAHRVSSEVNAVAHNGPHLLAPVPEADRALPPGPP